MFPPQKDCGARGRENDDDDASDDDSLNVTLESLYEAKENTDSNKEESQPIVEKRKDHPGSTSSE